MAYKPDGTWTAEDDNVANAVAGVTDKGGPLMKRAAGMGLAMANSRGLANSSMAAGASQGAVLDKAIQIGSQQSAQSHDKNLAALNATNQYKYGTDLAKLEGDQAKERLGMQIGADKDLQGGSLASAERIAGMQIASSEKLSGADIASREKLTGQQIASTEKLSANDIAARMSELATKIAGDRDLAAQGDVAAKQRLEMQLAEQARLEAMKIQSAEGMQSQQIASTERLSASEIGARMAELTTKIDADRALAAQGDTAAMARLEKDLASRAQLQDMQNRSAESIAAGNNATSLGVANIGASTSLATAKLQEEGATARQAAQNVATLQLQREKIAADTSISDADRAARLAEVDKNIASNQAIAQMQDQGATTRQESAQTAALQLQREKIASDTSISDADRAARLAEVDKQIASSQSIAQMQDAGATERAQLSETGATTRQQMGDEAALARQGAADTAALTRQREELANRTDISAADRAARLAEIDKQIAGNKDIATLEGTNALERQKLANEGAMDQQKLDSTTKLTLGEMESATSRSNNAVSNAISASNSYNDGVGQIMQNDKIPAAARDQALSSIKAATEAAIGVAEDAAGLNLGWGNNGKTVAAPTGQQPVASQSTPVAGWVQLPNGMWYDPAQGFTSL